MGGVPGQPAPTAGLSERRRGSRAGGAGWGGNAAHCCRLPLFLAAPSDLSAMRCSSAIGRYPPHGATTSGAPALRRSCCRSAVPVGERRADFARLLHLPKGQRLPGEGAADANSFPPAQRGVQGGGAYPLWGAWSGVTRERESAAGALPLLLNRSRPGWWSDSLRLAPAPLW